MGRMFEPDEYPDGINELPRDVSLSYSENESKGEVINEVRWVGEGSEGTYMHFLQLIKYEDSGEKYVRGGYYLKKEEEDIWRFMSRKAFHVKQHVAQEMFDAAQTEGIL